MKHRRDELQPGRMAFCLSELQRLGVIITEQTATEIRFEFRGSTVRLFPYTGWHTGKTITDGRGIDNLLKQLK